MLGVIGPIGSGICFGSTEWVDNGGGLSIRWNNGSGSLCLYRSSSTGQFDRAVFSTPAIIQRRDPALFVDVQRDDHADKSYPFYGVSVRSVEVDVLSRETGPLVEVIVDIGDGEARPRVECGGEGEAVCWVVVYSGLSLSLRRGRWHVILVVL